MRETMSAGTDPQALRRAWEEHRHFRYRGCAPDPDDPSRMAGDPSLPFGAHHGPDVDGGEPQKDRLAREAAAVAVCRACPVVAACDAYASSVTSDGRLAEPDGVWGGRLALERHRALIARRHELVDAAPDSTIRTPQKLAVLKALAGAWEPFEVARAADMDVRTANWQRSQLTRLLGLPKDVGRMRLLAVARERGLLADVSITRDDGQVPAVPPPTRTAPAAKDEGDDPTPSRPAPMPMVPRGPDDIPPVPMPTVPRPPGTPEPVPMPTVPSDPEDDVDRPSGPVRLLAPRRDRYTAIPGQLGLWPARTRTSPSHSLTVNDALEAAA